MFIQRAKTEEQEKNNTFIFTKVPFFLRPLTIQLYKSLKSICIMTKLMLVFFLTVK